MGELIDIFNDKGERTEKVVDRDTPDICFRPGERIAVAIIYIENDNNEFLIQKTSKKKGGIYSSTGGHVGHNEEPIETIKREVKEEIGIDISNDNIIDLGFLISDFPVRFIFYLKKNIDLNDVILQKDEVESILYMSEDELKQVIEKGLMHKAHAIVLNRVLDYRKNQSNKEII